MGGLFCKDKVALPSNCESDCENFNFELYQEYPPKTECHKVWRRSRQQSSVMTLFLVYFPIPKRSVLGNHFPSQHAANSPNSVKTKQLPLHLRIPKMLFLALQRSAPSRGPAELRRIITEVSAFFCCLAHNNTLPCSYFLSAVINIQKSSRKL